MQGRGGLLESRRVQTTVSRWLFHLTEDNQNVKIFSGTANETLARSICKKIGIPLGNCTIKPFPDGETFVKIDENVRGEDVFIVQPTSPPTNHNLMELFIMIDALRRALFPRRPQHQYV